jgi:hypothetical protein
MVAQVLQVDGLGGGGVEVVASGRRGLVAGDQERENRSGRRARLGTQFWPKCLNFRRPAHSRRKLR